MKMLRRVRGISVCITLVGGFASLATDCEPIPGGGPCKNCITDAQLTSKDGKTDLLLCVNSSIAYLGSQLEPGDDVPLAELLAPKDGPDGVRADWTAYAWQGSARGPALCTDCKAKVVATEKSDRLLLRVRNVTPVAGAKRAEVVLTGFNGVPFPAHDDEMVPPRFDLINVTPADRVMTCGQTQQNVIGSTCPGCVSDEGSTTLEVGNDPLRPAMALISFAAPLGGVAMCSGVLVSPRHVLTAAHCFPPGTGPASLRIAVGTRGASELAQAQGRQALADRIDVHPGFEEDMVDLAVVRLTSEVAGPHAILGTPGLTRENCGPGRSYGYGMFGQPSSAPPHYDFGELQTLKVNSSESVLCDGGLCFDSGTFAGVTTDNMRASALCHGDSGGPLVEVCDGVPYVVGVAAARIQSNQASAWEQVLTDWLERHQLETMSAAFAFSQGNICGSGNAIGFVTTRIDAPATYAWIRSVIGSTSAIGDFNSDARADVLRADAASGLVRMHPGGSSASRTWLGTSVRPGDQWFVSRIDGQASDALYRVGLPTAGNWTLDRHTWGSATSERLAPIGSKLDAPLVIDDGRTIVYPTGYLASKAPRMAAVANLGEQVTQSLGLMDATRRTSFAGTTHVCGDRDILTLTQSGQVLHHFDAACQWAATGTAARTREGQVLTVGSHHEIVWVGELPPSMQTGQRDIAADVVMVVRDLDRDAVDTSRMRFFSGAIDGANYVLDERTLVGPHIGGDEDVWLARVDDNDSLDLVFVARSSAAIEYSLYDPSLVGYGVRSPWPWVPAKAPRPLPGAEPRPLR